MKRQGLSIRAINKRSGSQDRRKYLITRDVSLYGPLPSRQGKLKAYLAEHWVRGLESADIAARAVGMAVAIGDVDDEITQVGAAAYRNSVRPPLGRLIRAAPGFIEPDDRFVQLRSTLCVPPFPDNP
jgi:hypothetical protein